MLEEIGKKKPIFYKKYINVLPDLFMRGIFILSNTLSLCCLTIFCSTMYIL